MLCLIDFHSPSITDWIQSIGVVIAAIGLIINFYFQHKSTRTQIESTLVQIAISKRDFARYLIEITPQLEFKNVNPGTQDAFISIRALNQPAIDLKVVNCSKDLISIEGLKKAKTLPAGGNFGIGYTAKHPVDIFDEYGYDYELELKYKDVLGNSYRQKIRTSSVSETVNFSHPQRTLKPEFENGY